MALHQQMVVAIQTCCEQFKVPMPSIKWSNQMTASAGRASAKMLKFSVPLLRVASEAFCIETAVHEAAHYIDFKLRGTSDHGEKWQAIMAQLGYPNPDRCHRLDRTHLYRYEVRCKKCGKVLVRYTRKPTTAFLRSKRSACCYAMLLLAHLEK